MMRKDNVSMKILFVCTGNTCRSPMAAALMRRELDKRGRLDIMIESAGLAAFGEPANPNAVQAVSELDEKYAQPLRQHRSRSVSAHLLEQADLIAVMSKSHAAAIVGRGVNPEKVHILSAIGGEGIGDPYGGDIDIYRLTRHQLEKAVACLADTLLTGRIDEK